MTHGGGDVRRYAESTTKRLLVGGLAITILGGTAAVFWVYGGAAAGLAFVCFLAMLLPVGLIMLTLAGIQWIVHRAEMDE